MKDGRSFCIRAGHFLFLLAGGISLANLLFLPYASGNYRYSHLLLLLSFLLFILLFRKGDQAIYSLSPLRAASLLHRLLPISFLGMLLICLLMGHFMEYTPSGDNFMLYQASQVLARQGHFDPGSDFILYFCRFSNQWGFLLFLTLFDKLLFSLGISHVFYPLVLLQTALYLLSFTCLFSLIRRKKGNSEALSFLLRLWLCFPLYLAAAVLYTDTFSLPFVLLAFCCIFRILEADSLSSRLLWGALTGFLLLLGGQIKMTVAIVGIAACICLPLITNPRKALPPLLLGFLIFLSGTQLIHGYVLDRYLDHAIYRQENTPIIHWVMMSIPDDDNPYGGFSQDYALTWRMMDEGASHKEVMDSIYSRMKDKIYHIRYPSRFIPAALRKNAAIIGDGSFGMTEMLDDGPVRYNILSKIVLENGPLYPFYVALTTGIWGANLLLALVAVLRRRHACTPLSLFLSVCCFGILLFLMLWEARSRYLFSYIPLFLLLSSFASEPSQSQEAFI